MGLARTSCPRGTSGPRTSCPGGQLVLGPRIRGDNLKRGGGTSHPMTSVLMKKEESASEISCITDHCQAFSCIPDIILGIISQRRHTFCTQINSNLVLVYRRKLGIGWLCN